MSYDYDYDYDTETDNNMESDYESKSNNIPPNVKSLYIYDSYLFNKPLDSLPKGLKYLQIRCEEFDRPLNNLPMELEYLEIQSYVFAQALDNLPIGLKHLIIKYGMFNRTLDNLPVGLETLVIICKCFNQYLDNLPPGIRKMHLKFNMNYCNNLDNLPESLEDFQIDGIYNNSFNIKCPSNLKTIIINANIEINILPNTVKQLELGRSCKSKFEKLPDNIESICVNINYCNIEHLRKLVEQMEYVQKRQIRLAIN